jgi:hypothetical protein
MMQYQIVGRWIFPFANKKIAKQQKKIYINEWKKLFKYKWEMINDA